MNEVTSWWLGEKMQNCEHRCLLDCDGMDGVPNRPRFGHWRRNDSDEGWKQLLDLKQW